MKWVITTHALKRLGARTSYSSAMPYGQRAAELRRELTHAHKLKQRSSHGHELWQIPSGPIAVVKVDEGRHVVVTIYDTLNGATEMTEDELPLAAQEYIAAQRAKQVEDSAPPAPAFSAPALAVTLGTRFKDRDVEYKVVAVGRLGGDPGCCATSPDGELRLFGRSALRRVKEIE